MKYDLGCVITGVGIGLGVAGTTIPVMLAALACCGVAYILING